MNRNIFEKAKDLAIAELEQKEFATTEQFLEIHEIEIENGRPSIASVNENSEILSVFFSVKNENFYFVVYLSINPDVEITGTLSEAKYDIFLRAVSEELIGEDIVKCTKLVPFKSWSIGDTAIYGNRIYNFTAAFFKQDYSADFFENTFEKFIDYLYTDKEGVKTLTDISYCNIEVVSTFHNGNTMLGGFSLSKDIIKKLAELDLNIDFYNEACGNFYLD